MKMLAITLCVVALVGGCAQQNEELEESQGVKPLLAQEDLTNYGTVKMSAPIHAEDRLLSTVERAELADTLLDETRVWEKCDKPEVCVIDRVSKFKLQFVEVGATVYVGRADLWHYRERFALPTRIFPNVFPNVQFLNEMLYELARKRCLAVRRDWQ